MTSLPKKIYPRPQHDLSQGLGQGRNLIALCLTLLFFGI